MGIIDTQNPLSRIGEKLIDTVGYKFNEQWTAVKRIEALGLDPKRVTDCIISHLDQDHIGALADFPNAKVHISTEELENYKSGNPRYLSWQLDHNPRFKTYSKSSQTWFDFEARNLDLGLQQQVYLIPLFGHTLGHCGVAIRDQSKWLLYVGDAYYRRSQLTNHIDPINELSTTSADDKKLQAATLSAIGNFITNHPEVTVFCYHDSIEFHSK
jgi:glyoxylase-like metal-dependent hydrolase (beta-lactamase superfamily II)